MYDIEYFSIGMRVATPSGRYAIVVRCLNGTSKRDCFARVICRYEGCGARDLVTLQPHQLTPVPPIAQGQFEPALSM